MFNPEIIESFTPQRIFSAWPDFMALLSQNFMQLIGEDGSAVSLGQLCDDYLKGDPCAKEKLKELNYFTFDFEKCFELFSKHEEMDKFLKSQYRLFFSEEAQADSFSYRMFVFMFFYPVAIKKIRKEIVKRIMADKFFDLLVKNLEARGLVISAEELKKAIVVFFFNSSATCYSPCVIGSDIDIKVFFDTEKLLPEQIKNIQAECAETLIDLRESFKRDFNIELEALSHTQDELARLLSGQGAEAGGAAGDVKKSPAQRVSPHTLFSRGLVVSPQQDSRENLVKQFWATLVPANCDYVTGSLGMLTKLHVCIDSHLSMSERALLLATQFLTANGTKQETTPAGVLLSRVDSPADDMGLLPLSRVDSPRVIGRDDTLSTNFVVPLKAGMRPFDVISAISSLSYCETIIFNEDIRRRAAWFSFITAGLRSLKSLLREKTASLSRQYNHDPNYLTAEDCRQFIKDPVLSAYVFSLVNLSLEANLLARNDVVRVNELFSKEKTHLSEGSLEALKVFFEAFYKTLILLSEEIMRRIQHPAPRLYLHV